MVSPTNPIRLEPHVCDYHDLDGTSNGFCHLLPPHGGLCPTCSHAAPDCSHQPDWETVLLCSSSADCEVHR